MFFFQRLIHAAFLLSLICSPDILRAQDVFIRPDAAPAGNRPSIDYGLKARPAQPSPSLEPQPTQPQPQQAQAPAPVQPRPVLVPQTPVAPTPAPVQQTSISTTNPDVTILKLDPDPAPSPGVGPNSLTINMAPAQLSAEEIGLIAGSLNLSAAEVASNCATLHSVMLDFDQAGAALLPAKSQPSLNYKYTGILKQISVFVSSACRIIRSPRAGIITEQEGRYVISLGHATCPGNANSTLTLSFRYKGDGQADCRYQ